MKELLITIDRHGEVSLDVTGAVGDECTKLTEPLERALGAVLDRQEKPEMYAPPQQQLHGAG